MENYSDNLKEIIEALTYVRDENGELVPTWAFVNEIIDQTGYDEKAITAIAKKLNYNVFKVFATEEYEGGKVIAPEKISADIIKADYAKFFGVEPEIEQENKKEKTLTEGARNIGSQEVFDTWAIDDESIIRQYDDGESDEPVEVDQVIYDDFRDTVVEFLEQNCPAGILFGLEPGYYEGCSIRLELYDDLSMVWAETTENAGDFLPDEDDPDDYTRANEAIFEWTVELINEVNEKILPKLADFGFKLYYNATFNYKTSYFFDHTDDVKIEKGDNGVTHLSIDGGEDVILQESLVHNGIDYTTCIQQIVDYIANQGLELSPLPQVMLDNTDQEGLLIRTGYYDPDKSLIVLFTKDRHPKDILRTLAHELIHHNQKLTGKGIDSLDTNQVVDSKDLEDLEGEAYREGNLYFRKWTEDNKDIINKINKRSPDTVEAQQYITLQESKKKKKRKGRSSCKGMCIYRSFMPVGPLFPPKPDKPKEEEPIPALPGDNTSDGTSTEAGDVGGDVGGGEAAGGGE